MTLFRQKSILINEMKSLYDLSEAKGISRDTEIAIGKRINDIKEEIRKIDFKNKLQMTMRRI